MRFYLACVLLCATSSFVQAGPATLSDVRILKGKMNTIRRVIKYINLEIAYVEKVQKSWNASVNKIRHRQLSYVKSARKRNDKSEKKLIVMAQRYTESLLRKSKYDVSKKLSRKLYEESKKDRAEWKKIFREAEDTFKYVRQSALVVRRKNHYNIKKARQVRINTLNETMANIKGYKTQYLVNKFDRHYHVLVRQLQTQQYFASEKIRTDGFSGIKQIKSTTVGGKNYLSAGFKDDSVVGIHDHGESENLLGVGDFAAVLHGVYFRNNRQDYSLAQPSYTGTYDHTVPVEFPRVPGNVRDAETIEHQIKNMRQWFVDFKNGKDGVGEYFKPVMSYVEGVWSNNQPVADEETEKILYQMNSATPDSFTYNPVEIMGVTALDKKVRYSKWNTRIISHPISSSKKLSPTKFAMRNDIISKVRYHANQHQQRMEELPVADFYLEHLDENGVEKNRPQDYTYLDSIMEDIIGKENENTRVTTSGLDHEHIKSVSQSSTEPFNAGKYHRVYTESSQFGMQNIIQRSFSDKLYMAFTTQRNVSAVTMKEGNEMRQERVSYAFPFEVVFTTPLHNWNPYHVTFKENCNDVEGIGTLKDPYTATCSRLYFFTPLSFFSGTSKCGSFAEAPSHYFVSGIDGKPVCLVSSGTRIVLPLIDGQKERIRQRYSIVPAYRDGHSASKKLNAIEDGLLFSADQTTTSVSIKTGYIPLCCGNKEGRKYRLHLNVEQLEHLSKYKTSNGSKINEKGQRSVFKVLQFNKSRWLVHCKCIQRSNHYGYGY